MFDVVFAVMLFTKTGLLPARVESYATYAAYEIAAYSYKFTCYDGCPSQL